MHRQRACNLKSDELLRQLQDIPEDESDASDDDIFEPNLDEDEDYEPPKAASDSSCDCDVEDTCRLGEELEDDVQQQVRPAMNVGQAGCSTRRRGTARRNRGRGRGRCTGRVEFMGHPVDTGDVVKDNEKKWTVIESGRGASGRFGSHNVLKKQPGPTPHATRSVSEDKVSSAWRLFIDDSILHHIKHCTEDEAARAGEQNWSLVIEELDAFIALVYERGAYGCRSVDFNVLWNVNWGPRFYPDTMSRNKFREIMRYLRFDLKRTHSQLLQSDKFALASEVWPRFIDNCFLCYRPGENLNADEQLFPSKARCRFTQYMANKPGKFGIKFLMLVENDTKYLCNAFPYLGKDELRSANESLPDSIVMRLSSPYLNKGRNFFTSASPARTIKAKDTSIVGTISHTGREIPAVLAMERVPLYETTLLRNGDGATLTVYQGKVNKNVLLLSTLHSTTDIGTNRKKLPETVQFYNKTKHGVDILDQMARGYSTRAAALLWPVHVFYNILDLVAINAWIIYRGVTGKNEQACLSLSAC